MIARLHAAITPVRVAWLTVGVVVGVASGSAAASTPTIQAPHECQVMATTAERIFVSQANEVTVTQLRATRGQSEFAQHEADLSSLWDEQDELAADYEDAKTECLGGAK